VTALGHAQAQAPRIERLDPALDAIVPAGATFEPLRTDYFGYLEGPVWVPARPSGYLLFSDVPANRIYKWDGQLSVWMAPSGFTGNDSSNAGMEYNNGRIQIIGLGSNGLTLDREGRVIFCAHGDRALKRREKDGTVTVLADSYEGRRFSGPNDVVVRSDGSIYFTDLFGGLRGDRSLAARGLPYGLYRLFNGKLERLLYEPSFGPAGDSPGVGPNGLAFSPDEKLLYVAASQYVLRYDVEPDGTLTNRGVLFDMGTGGVDGIKVDTAGNVYAMGQSGVSILAADGKLLGRLRVSGANLAFGGEHGKSLYLAAQRDLYRIDLKIAGIHPLPDDSTGSVR
jgi:gluconolactonase